VGKRFRIVDDKGNLLIPPSLLYTLLKHGARLEGPFIVVEKLPGAMEEVPTVRFCPSTEIRPIDTDDPVLRSVCYDLYRYFEDRCAACAVKVYSVLGSTWLYSEDVVTKLLDVARKYGLPVEWSRGNIVFTTCPEDYSEAYRRLRPGDYVKGLELLRRACLEIGRIVEE